MFVSYTHFVGQRVVILGASNSSERYAYRAFIDLRRHGHEVLPVSPNVSDVDGVPCAPALGQITGAVDTLTLYVNPRVSETLIDDIVALRPGRVIFNPGSENASLRRRLDDEGIAHEDACTLVLLSTGQF